MPARTSNTTNDAGVRARRYRPSFQFRNRLGGMASRRAAFPSPLSSAPTQLSGASRISARSLSEETRHRTSSPAKREKKKARHTIGLSKQQRKFAMQDSHKAERTQAPSPYPLVRIATQVQVVP